MKLQRYAPFRRNVSPLWDVSNEINQLFGDSPFGGLFPEGEKNWSPSLDVVEETDRYLVKLELPGLTSSDVKITFEESVLNITGERKSENVSDENKLHLSERYYGTFERAIRFPNPVEQDKVSAKFTDGILEIALPKTEEARPRNIEISPE